MVTLFILLGLVYNSSATGFEQNPYAALWRKVETAMQDGKPQTASGYLEEIEKAAEKDGNLLEQLDAMAQRADCISQYNWKEYNIYNRKYLHLRDSVYNNLDENIERFANHPKVVILIKEKIERMLREARNKRPMEGKDFEKIREICRKTIDQFPRTQSAKRIQETIDSLEERYLTTSANTVLYPGDTSEIEISCRNIGQVKITQLLGDKIVKKVTVSDLKNEFAISETKKIKWNFPVEGEYVMLFEGGDKSCRETIYVSKIGFAYRRGKDGREIYVADLKTGRPYDEASVQVSSIDGRQKEHLVSQKEYSLDGFTKLTQKWDDKNQIKIRVEAGKDFSAAPLYPSEFYRNRSEHKEYDGCYIYTDRKLYKPTDTVQFKVIAWHISDNQGNVRTSQKVKVDLFAPGEKDPVASQIITTNDMGSASGAFTIPEGSKNGQYHISTNLSTAYFRVEEYKAPAFYAEMPKIDGLYGFDDVISQRGKVTSYAGYPVQGAKVEYTILRSAFWSRDCYQWFESENIARQSTATDENGEFSISFKALRPDVKGKLSAMFEVSVTVTDLQGNTISNMIMVPVSDMPVYMEAEFENEIDNGDFKVIDKNREKGVLITAFNNNGIRQEMNGEFELLSGDKCVLKGSFKSGERAMIDFKAIQSGEYTLKYSTVWRGKTFTSTKRYAIFDPGDKYSPTKDELFFSPVLGDEESVNFVLGTGKGNLWLEVELYDYTGRVFRKAVYLNSDMQKFSVKVPEKWCSYNEPLTLSVFGILNKKIVSRTHSFDHPSPSHSFQLEIESFRDKTTPGTKEKLIVKGKPGELTASIFDISTDRYGANWFEFNPFPVFTSYAPNIAANFEYSYRYSELEYEGAAMMSYSSPAKLAKSVAPMDLDTESNMADGVATEDIGSGSAEEGPRTQDISLRNDFGETIAFYPHIRIGENGIAEVEYTAGDNLSTFRVLLLAHTKDLSHGRAERSFVVAKEVMVDPSVPLFATEGDRLTILSNVVNLTDRAIEGKAWMELRNHDTGEKIRDYDKIAVSLLASGQKNVCWTIEKIPEGIEKMDVAVYFAAGNLTDGEMHTVEIVPATRTLTETASFLIGSGRSFDYYKKELQKRIGASDAIIRCEEYSTLDAVKEALKPCGKPSGDNLISWINYLYVNQMRTAIGEAGLSAEDLSKTVRQFKKNQNSDGGFGWFPGNGSSDLLTLLMLEKCAQLERYAQLGEDLDKIRGNGVRYIDKQIEVIISESAWEWTSLTDYFAVRVQYPEIAMPAKVREAFNQYIEKSAEGWQKISILSKAKHLRVIMAARDGAFAYKESVKSLDSRVAKLTESLKDYAVTNDTVGCYFPNAVMPWRGLMHTEIYAHSQLLELFNSLGEKKLVRGLSQWLLLQKHNQAWENNMATADAVIALICGKVDDLRFGAVYYTYTAPMLNVKAAANELSVSRKYYRDGKLLRDGETLNVGDRIEVRYEIHNSENRSFVEMRAMRPACFYPEDERSYSSWHSYMEKKGSHTTWYFQLLQEEDSSFSEVFFVTQKGKFNSGLVEIESLYATEYRGHTGAMVVEAR